MPGGDRTGPWGEGPRTGGGFGDCPPGAGQSRSWVSGRGWAPRWGGSRGRGRGWGRGYGPGPFWGRGRFWGWGARTAAPEPTQEQELADLETEASWLEEGLDAVRARIEALKGRNE